MLKKQMKKKVKPFDVVNNTFLIIIGILCLFPLVHITALSFSSGYAIDSNMVKLWPVEFTLEPYTFVVTEPAFYAAFFVTVKRTVLGVLINMLLTILAAYPLSKSKQVFHKRQIYVWFFMFAILFSGGLIPWYIVISKTGLIDTIWALVLPSAVPVWNIILLHNFFKALPPSIEESAVMDGATPWQVLFKIYVPLSKASLATLTLFAAVGHWNEWFAGMILMNRPSNYPLQTYLQSVLVQRDLNLASLSEVESLLEVSQRNSNAAKIIIAMLPILLIYPFLQKHFAKGMILGSVKG